MFLGAFADPFSGVFLGEFPGVFPGKCSAIYFAACSLKCSACGLNHAGAAAPILTTRFLTEKAVSPQLYSQAFNFMQDKLFAVNDQVVLISGASRGIGKAIAAGFVERGSQVIITGREQETLDAAVAELAGGAYPATAMVCDVADPAAICDTVAATLESYGRIDTLINVAGVNRRKPSLEITDEDYDFVVDINQKGAFIFSREVGRHMVERGGGSQINIASLNTDRPLKNVTPYAMSKAAMGAMTRALAMEWGPHGVRVNAVAPGFILTDLSEKLWSDERMHAWGVANTPQRRLGVPADMAGATLFLASEASAFMTGQIMFVDGGFTAGFEWPIPQA